MVAQRPSDAIAAFDKLSTEPHLWPLAKVQIAEILYRQGKKAEVFRTFNDVIAQRPRAPQARIVRGQLLLADGRIDDALTDGQQAAKLDRGTWRLTSF